MINGFPHFFNNKKDDRKKETEFEINFDLKREYLFLLHFFLFYNLFLSSLHFSYTK